LDLVWTEKRLERLKWYLWPGNGYEALQRIEMLEWDLEEGEVCSEKAAPFLKAVPGFGHSIDINQNAIRTTETGTATERRSRPPLSNPRSIRW
jgi:hypothetical protein